MAFSPGHAGPQGRAAMAEINVTPLVDVMLVLLIIFMVTTSSASQKQIDEQKQESVKEKTENLVDLNLPVTENNPLVADPETNKLVVVVDKSLRVFVVRGVTGAAGQKPIADCSSQVGATDPKAWEGCLDLVVQALQGNRRLLKDGLYLQGDAEAPYGFVGGLLARLRGIGVQQVDIVTNPGFREQVLEPGTAPPSP